MIQNFFLTDCTYKLKTESEYVLQIVTLSVTMQLDTGEQDTELSMYKRLYNIDSNNYSRSKIDFSLTVKAVTLILFGYFIC